MVLFLCSVIKILAALGLCWLLICAILVFLYINKAFQDKDLNG